MTPREYPLYSGTSITTRQPYQQETNPVTSPADPQVKLVRENSTGELALEFKFGGLLRQAKTTPVTTAMLGTAKIPELPYENADGSDLFQRITPAKTGPGNPHCRAFREPSTHGHAAREEGIASGRGASHSLSRS